MREKDNNMAQEQAFWPVHQEPGNPECFFVCMSCFKEVFWRKVPEPDCPTCHGLCTYEAFALESIRDWGSEELIKKAEMVRADAVADRLQGSSEIAV